MNKPTDVILIYYMDGGVKTYIKSSTWNNRRQIVATYTLIFTEAQQWPNMPEAMQIIRDLNDNKEKDYKTEWVTLDLPVDFRFRTTGAASY